MTKQRTATVVALMVVFISVICVLVGRPSADWEYTEPEEGFDSPRLAELSHELKVGDRAAVDRFWKEIHRKAPLIEPVKDDPHSVWISFVWRGDSKTRRVNVQGGPGSGDFANWMKRLGDTELWYRTDRIPVDSRFDYFFQVNRPLKFPPQAHRLPPVAPPRADPLNPSKVSSRNASLVELPGAPPQPWLQRSPGVPRGELSEQEFASEIIRAANPGFDHKRRFMVYTPPNYDPKGQPCGLLILFDGHVCRNPEMPVPVIVDNLISMDKIPPLVVVFVYQSTERDEELWSCSEPFADFVAKELVPWVRKKYQVSGEPSHTTIGGMSAGGLMAAYCGFRHHEVIGNVLSLSGGFGWWPGILEERFDEEPGWLTRQFVSGPRLPVRFYLAAGHFENWFLPYNLLVENRRFRDVLLSRGYSVQFQEFSGGHTPVSWRGPFVEGLITLTGTPR